MLNIEPVTEEKIKKLANKIKYSREKKKLSIRALAEKSDLLTISEISFLENAKRKKPDPIILKALAHSLGDNYLDYFKILGYLEGDDILTPVNRDNKVPVYSSVFADTDNHLEFGELIEYISTTHIKNIDEIFGIKVEDNSMFPTIPEHSTILIRKGSEINEGSVGVFLLNNKPLLKRYKKQGEYVLLISDNTQYEPIIVNKDDQFLKVGKVIQMLTIFN